MLDLKSICAGLQGEFQLIEALFSGSGFTESARSAARRKLS
jgi:hypothetical protein